MVCFTPEMGGSIGRRHVCGYYIPIIFSQPTTSIVILKSKTCEKKKHTWIQKLEIKL
jgi:hypothetical protein